MGILRKTVKRVVVGTYRLLLPLVRTDGKMIVFDASTGGNYTGNPRAIYEYMVNCGLDKEYRLVWFFKKGKAPKEMPGNCKVVKFASISYLYHMMKAGTWVFDARQPAFLKKKKDQKYIQTWHGTPLKKLALDMEDVSMAKTGSLSEYKKSFADNAAAWDYLIAQNEFSAETFKRCFAFKGTVLKTGYPRNDVLFSGNNKENISALKEKYGIPKNKKVLLYAPTFRDDEFNAAEEYKFTPKLDFKKLMEELSDEYVIIVKYHYLVSDKINWDGYSGFVYPFTGEAEISSLYLMADALITDYSSVMFDYSLLGRPMYFYAYDLEKYRDSLRGFYFDLLSEAPGPVSRTTEELISDIKKYKTEKKADQMEKYTNFSAKYHTFEKGNASKQIADLILSGK